MHIFLTGASGYVGTPVLSSLVARGHTVTALVRTDQKADAVRAAGGTAVVGDLTDGDLVTPLLQDAEAVIHTAAPGDATGAAFDEAFTDLVIAALGGTPKPYVHTGGVWVFGSSTDVTEQSPFAPPAITAWRIDVEQKVRQSDVQSTIIAPGIVYGHGAGIPTVLTAGDPVLLVGDGTQHWTTVHVDDLADLYVLAIEAGAADEYVLGVGGDNPTVRELGEAFAHGGDVVPRSVDDTREALGAPFADALLLDQIATGAHARSRFGWAPSRPTLVEEFSTGSYAR